MASLDPNMGIIITASDGWSEHISRDGRKYYFNTLTQESQWEKPISLLSTEEAQILMKTGWQEFTAAGERKFWFHSQTKRSVWSTPKEVEELLKSLEEEREDWSKFTSKDEAKKFLIKLFDLKKFPPRISWENAVKILEVDRRWSCFSILSRGERKQTFSEYMSQRSKRAAEEERHKRQKANDLLIEHLLKWSEFGFGTTYINIADRFHNEEWWTWIGEADRDDFLQEWMYDNESKLKDRFRAKRREKVAQLEDILERNPEEFSFRNKWDDMKKILFQHPQLQDVLHLDILQVWEEWVRHGYSQDRQKRRAVIFRSERKNRDAFKELLNECIDKGELTHKTQWIPFIFSIHTDPRYYNMVGQGGSTPRELFEDAVDQLQIIFQKNTEVVMSAIRQKNIDIVSCGNFTRFYDMVRNIDSIKNLSVLKTKAIYEELLASPQKLNELLSYDKPSKSSSDRKEDSHKSSRKHRHKSRSRDRTDSPSRKRRA